MLTGSKDGKVYYWAIGKADYEEEQKNAQQLSFTLLKRYKAHSNCLSSVNFSNSGESVFVTSGMDGLIKLWNMDNNSCKSMNCKIGELNFGKFTPNNKIVVTGSKSKMLHFYATDDLALKATLDTEQKGVWDADFSQNEFLLATCSSDNTIKIWNYKNLNNIEHVMLL